jgi:hypothetical protein
MNRVTLVVVMVLVSIVCGCSSPKFTAPRYKIDPNGIGVVHLNTPNKIYISPTIERLGEDNRKLIDPNFSTTAYLTDALEKELTAAGVTPLRTPFAVGPDFRAAQETIVSQANKQEGAVYLVSEVRWFGPVKLTLDAKLYSPSGTILFEKRGLCMILNTSVTSQKITNMALRQILADPAFQKAVQ